MAILVQKYGGSSVGSIQHIQNVADHILEAQAAGNEMVVIVSAMAGETDRLISLAHLIAPQIVIASCRERV